MEFRLSRKVWLCCFSNLPRIQTSHLSWARQSMTKRNCAAWVLTNADNLPLNGCVSWKQTPRLACQNDSNPGQRQLPLDLDQQDDTMIICNSKAVPLVKCQTLRTKSFQTWHQPCQQSFLFRDFGCGPHEAITMKEAGCLRGIFQRCVKERTPSNVNHKITQLILPATSSSQRAG